jgi:mevalonate pyrophosphate decarboxylase
MNIISNTLISLESDPRISITTSITSVLNEEKIELHLDEKEYEISMETLNELLEVLRKTKSLLNHVN